MYSTMVRKKVDYVIVLTAAIQFIPYDKLEELGYGDLIPHFEK